jgi:two-component system, OmpR family, phosphate regulon response regulator OmpR
MQTILMIEDDARLATMVADYLRAAGFDVEIAGSGKAGLAAVKRATPDLVLLDLMLPDGDGLDVFRAIRAIPGATAELPVLMLTAKGDPTDRVVGLELGAEDYVTKPFEPRELLARIKRSLRRGSGVAGETQDILRFGRLEIDRGARVARVGGEIKLLTSHQFAILRAMAERAGRVLTREQIMDAVSSEPQDYDSTVDRSIDVHIGRIRSAIEDNPKAPRRIITVRGAGYVFAKVQD